MLHLGGVRAPLPVSPVSDSVVVLFTAGVFPGLLIGSVPSVLFHSIPHSVDVWLMSEPRRAPVHTYTP